MYSKRYAKPRNPQHAGERDYHVGPGWISDPSRQLIRPLSDDEHRKISMLDAMDKNEDGLVSCEFGEVFINPYGQLVYELYFDDDVEPNLK